MARSHPGGSSTARLPISPLVGEMSGRTERALSRRRVRPSGGTAEGQGSASGWQCRRSRRVGSWRPCSAVHLPLVGRSPQSGGWGTRHSPPPRLANFTAFRLLADPSHKGEGKGRATCPSPSREEWRRSGEREVPLAPVPAPGSSAVKLPISPLVGEMSGRTERGAVPPARHDLRDACPARIDDLERAARLVRTFENCENDCLEKRLVVRIKRTVDKTGLCAAKRQPALAAASRSLRTARIASCN